MILALLVGFAFVVLCAAGIVLGLYAAYRFVFNRGR